MCRFAAADLEVLDALALAEGLPRSILIRRARATSGGPA